MTNKNRNGKRMTKAQIMDELTILVVVVFSVAVGIAGGYASGKGAADKWYADKYPHDKAAVMSNIILEGGCYFRDFYPLDHSSPSTIWVEDSLIADLPANESEQMNCYITPLVTETGSK
jgi:hypothetical protein